MSAELISILGVGVALLSVGVALGALILAGRRDAAQRLADMHSRLARVEGLLLGLGCLVWPVRQVATSVAPGNMRGCPGVAMSLRVAGPLVVPHRAHLPGHLDRQPGVEAQRAPVAPTRVLHGHVE